MRPRWQRDALPLSYARFLFKIMTVIIPLDYGSEI